MPDEDATPPSASPESRTSAPARPWDLSATTIRERLAHGQDIGTLVSEPVARYIADHHLYQTT